MLQGTQGSSMDCHNIVSSRVKVLARDVVAESRMPQNYKDRVKVSLGTYVPM